MTQSRTGMGWRRLVNEVAHDIEADMCKRQIPDERCAKNFAERIEESADAPLKNASLIYALMEEMSGDGTYLEPQDRLRESLTTILYSSGEQSNALGTGSLQPSEKSSSRVQKRYEASESIELLRYVCNTAVALSNLGKQIVIATTNYDVYLEDELEIISAITRIGDDSSKINSGCDFEIMGVECLPKSESIWGRGVEKNIPLVYLHGRLGKKSSRTEQRGQAIGRGEVVFSETQYAFSEPRVSAWLKSLTRGADCMLILGASMEDRPLLQILHKNSQAREDSLNFNRDDVAQEFCKNTLLLKSAEPISAKAPRLEKSEKEIRSKFEDLRYRHLGIDHYVSVETYADVPVFLRDVLLCVEKCRSETASGSNGKLIVPDHLSAMELSIWCKATSGRLRSKKLLKALYELLNEAENTVLSRLFPILSGDGFEIAQSDLSVKLELWLRGVEPFEGEIARVVRVVDSDSITLSSDSRRSEDLYRRFASRTAAIRGMQYGQVQLDSLESFGESSSASRWQGYYVLPLTHDLGGKYRILIGSLVVCIGILGQNGKTYSVSDREELQAYIREASSRLHQRKPDIRDAADQLFETVSTLGLQAISILEGNVPQSEPWNI